MNDFNLTDPTFSQLIETALGNLLLLENSKTLKSIIKYIFTTRQFGETLFQRSHLDSRFIALSCFISMYVYIYIYIYIYVCVFNISVLTRHIHINQRVSKFYIYIYICMYVYIYIYIYIYIYLNLKPQKFEICVD